MKTLFATMQKGFLIGESIVFFSGAMRCYKSNFKLTTVFTDQDENPELPNSDSYRSFSEESKTNKNSVTKVTLDFKIESRKHFENRCEMRFQRGFTMILNDEDSKLEVLKKHH